MALEAQLRENMMDGETLLTYELLFSRRELMELLGITVAKHQTSLVRKLMALQKQSPAFCTERRAIENEQALAPEPVHYNVASGCEHVHNTLAHGPEPQHQDSIVSLSIASQANGEEPKPQAGQSNISEEPLQKRRRLIPTIVRDIQVGDPNARMSGFEEPDHHNYQRIRQASHSSSGEDSLNAYLGKKALTETSVIPLEIDIESDSGSDTFQSIANPLRPRGRTYARYSMLKKFLLRNNRKASKIQNGAVAAVKSDGGDYIVNFDDLASLDDDTLREIADEEAENTLAGSSTLDSEAVEFILNEEIARIKSDWEKKKLPKLEKKAHRLWSYSRKYGLLREHAIKARQQVELYRNRLASLTKDLRSLPWKNEEELRFQTHSIEQTVVDKLHQEWLTSLFSLRTLPPKVASPPTQQTRSAHAKNIIHNDELLSSSEEEYFIVDDEQLKLARAPSSPTLHLPDSPAANREPGPLNTNGAHTLPHITQPASQADSVIDLTAHSDVEMQGTDERLVPTAFESFNQDFLEEIGNVSPKVWAKQKDRFRLAISILWKLPFARREAVFALLARPSIRDLWSNLLVKAYERMDRHDGRIGIDDVFDLTFVFLSFVRCKHLKEEKVLTISDRDAGKLEDSAKDFAPFCSFLFSIKDGFPQQNQIARLDAWDDELFASSEEIDPANPITASAKKPKKKEIILDRGAVALRERETRLIEEQEKRRNELRANLKTLSEHGTVSNKTARLIINEAKETDQGFIYVNKEIAPQIKDHQIEGVRFMWNHIVRPSSQRQGCLLAHTMGLGKTMQTITFLVALREAAASGDPTVRGQIPEDLRDWWILVLCPSGLVENWKDEFLLWAPKDIMGQIITIEAANSSLERLDHAKQWAAGGGILIIGYNMFKSEYNKFENDADTIDRIIVEKATVVVADEAHVLKNPRAKISQLTSKLKTSTRIALTGSPLANNVEEYYSMIDWVAPNFLGPLQEFRERYVNPIQLGLYTDSTNFEKRNAIKMLQVLKETAAPKVHRATIKSCLKNELPPKEEFVISVPPTDMQRRLYDQYISSMGDSLSQAGLFGVLNNLALVCAHPATYRRMVINLKTSANLGKQVAKFPMDIIPRILRMTGAKDLDRTGLSYKVELLNKILDQSHKMGDKVLVFSQSIPTLDYLDRLFKTQGRAFYRLDGSTTISKRQDMVKRFNTGDAEVYLISTTAGGVGLNIHGANRVVIFDFKWNPVQDQQAIGRSYRIGQKKPVFVYRFVVAGTFEDDLQNKAVFKMQLASRVVDQKNPVSWSKRLQKLIHPVRTVLPTDARFEMQGKDAILDHLLQHDAAKCILSAMSSDTFEEEDETATLTAEERQEAQSLVEQHQLRISDPAEYSRLMEAERRAAIQKPISNIAPSKPNTDFYPERPDHVFNPTTATAPVLLPSQAVPRASTPAAPVLTANATPLVGANTFFGSPPVSTPVSQVDPAPIFGAESCAGARMKFEQKLSTAMAPIEARFPNCSFHANTKTISISEDVQLARRNGNKGFAVDTLRWNKLTSMLTNNKFVLALASGQMSGSFIGTADDSDLQTRLQMLENLSDDLLFGDIAKGGKAKDPEVRGAHQELVQRAQE